MLSAAIVPIWVSFQQTFPISPGSEDFSPCLHRDQHESATRTALKRNLGYPPRGVNDVNICRI